MKALSVDQVSRQFGGVTALTAITFSIDVGERVAIIGPNGAGKTTLFNVMNGQLAASGGSIFLFDKDITRLSINRRAHLGLGRSFQVTNLFPKLTVMKNALLAVHGVERRSFNIWRPMVRHSETYERAALLLTQWDLWEHRNAKVHDLAYGDQRKLEMAVTFGSSPKILLLDEPSNGLTTAESGEMIQKIRALGSDITVVLVAHDMDLVFSVAERIIVLHQGGVLKDGPVDQIRADPDVREIYMGERDAPV